MNNIYYLEEEALKHLDSTKKVNSLLWKIMYKRVVKRLEKSNITAENIKKIIFNRNLNEALSINAPLPYIMVQNQASWYLADDSVQYYLPLSICFTNGKIRFEIVLVNGIVDLRVVEIEEKKSVLKHNPILLIKNFEVLNLSFELLLEYLEKNK